MSELIRALLLISAIGSLMLSCGFATAPIKHGVARTAQLGVKGTDAGIEYGKEAATVVKETAISVADAAIDGLRPENIQNADEVVGTRRPGK